MCTTRIAEIQQSALRRLEDARVSEPERIGSPSIGDAVRQGDLYLLALDPSYEGETPVENRQLAPGTTKGSRHVLTGDATMWAENPTDYPSELKGPTFRCNSECPVKHPEHATKILPADTTWAVIHQRVHADEVRRVRD
jgi:hypothetical protein